VIELWARFSRDFVALALGFSILWACAWGQLKFRVILVYKFHMFSDERDKIDVRDGKNFR